MKKKKEPRVDGMGPKDVANIRKACRQVWHWSYPKKLVVARCMAEKGFSRCEKCHEIVAKIFVDHITKVGDVDGGFLIRLFTSSDNLQGLCKECHDQKTKEEKREGREKENDEIPDFF